MIRPIATKFWQSTSSCEEFEKMNDAPNDISVSVATLAHVTIIVSNRTLVARDLTRPHGRGH